MEGKQHQLQPEAEEAGGRSAARHKHLIAFEKRASLRTHTTEHSKVMEQINPLELKKIYCYKRRIGRVFRLKPENLLDKF